MVTNRETERGFAKKEYKSNQDGFVLQSMRSDILQDSIQLSAAPSQYHEDKKLNEIKVTQSVSSIQHPALAMAESQPNYHPVSSSFKQKRATQAID